VRSWPSARPRWLMTFLAALVISAYLKWRVSTGKGQGARVIDTAEAQTQNFGQVAEQQNRGTQAQHSHEGT